MLYIPKNWWHWIDSYGRCISVNFWWKSTYDCSPNKIPMETHNTSTDIKQGVPTIFRKGYNYLTEKWTDYYLLSKIEHVNIWNSDTDKIYRDNFASFMNRKQKNEYIMTLNAYNNNQEILDKIGPDIIIPRQIKDKQPDNNFWFTYNYANSGLHYDDDDGLLCVIDGRKKIILFPPEDSIYLDAYPLYPEWATKFPEHNISYNTYKSQDWYNAVQQNSLPSSYILWKTIKYDNPLVKLINSIYNKYGSNKIIYGIKNHNGNIRWEFYFYNLNKNPTDMNIYKKFSINDIHKICDENNIEHTSPNHKIGSDKLVISSFDYQHGPKLSTDIDFYYFISHGNPFPYIMEVYNYTTNIHKGYQIVDTYTSMKKNLNQYLHSFGILDQSIYQWIFRELDRYVNISKNNIINNINVSLVIRKDTIGIGWFGINYNLFLKFLVENKWMDDLIMFWKNNESRLNHLTNEIFVHYTHDGAKIRSSFYGVI